MDGGPARATWRLAVAVGVLGRYASLHHARGEAPVMTEPGDETPAVAGEPGRDPLRASHADREQVTAASVQPPEENAPAEADRARSQAERDAPHSEHGRIKKPRRRRIRRSVVGLLVALSCLLVLLSTTEVWAHRTLLNTGAFVGTVAPVFEESGGDLRRGGARHGRAIHRAQSPGPPESCAASQGQFRGRPGRQCHQGFRGRSAGHRDGVPSVPGHLDRNANLHAPAAGGGVARPAYGGCFHLWRLHRPQHRPPHQPGPGEGVGPGL